MIKNYFKVGLRNLRRNKLYSTINITGLAVGLGAFFLILLFVTDELSYDKHFDDADKIHRVILDGAVAGNSITSPTTPAPLARTMLQNYPEIQQAVRMRGTTLGSDPITVKIGDQLYRESHVIYADSNFFNFFGLSLRAGSSTNALANPNSVVLAPETAKKYFGNQNPVGQSIRLMDMDQEFQVTGIADPLLPNTHFHFDILASLVTDQRSRSTRWLGGLFMTYVKLNQAKQAEVVNQKFSQLVKERVVPQMEDFMGIPFSEFLNQGGAYRFFLQPLTDIYLDSNLDTEWEANGNRTYVYIFTFVGIMIIAIAGINFTNLATSQSASRAKEIGMRKVLGSARKQLILQFITEALIISMIATVLAIAIINFTLPFFNDLAGKTFIISDIFDPTIFIVFILITFALGIASGFYPAIYLSSLNPRNALSGEASQGKTGTRLRNILVIFQFTIATSLIICTFIVGDQLEYVKNKDLGFDKEQILVINNANVLKENREAFRNELLKKPGISNVSFSTSIPGKGVGRAAYQPENNNETLVYPFMSIDHSFLDVYQIPIIEGRVFSQDRSNELLGVILNRNAVANIGFNDPIGKIFNSQMEGAQPLQVIGVVDDFHFQSLHKQIQPLILEYIRPDDILNFVSIKLTLDDIPRTLASIEQTWKTFVPGYTFDYESFSQSFESLYQNDIKLGSLIQAFAVIAILIGCLGLFGLMVYTTHKRRKEVGVRKVLGSTAFGIVLLFLKNMVSLLLIAVSLALPLSYMFMNDWLQNFAYRTGISAWPFVTGTLLTFLVAIATVSYLVARAASINPATVIQNN